MEQEKEQLWAVFEQWALENWRSGADAPCEIGVSLKFLFGLRCSPAFTNPVNWQIYSKLSGAQKNNYFATRREWNVGKDQHRFASAENLMRYKYRGNLQPSFNDDVVTIPEELVKPLLDTISSKPLFLEKISGSLGCCDGTSYQLVLGDLEAGVTLYWWGNGPQNWRDIVTVAIATINELERLHSPIND